MNATSSSGIAVNAFSPSGGAVYAKSTGGITTLVAENDADGDIFDGLANGKARFFFDGLGNLEIGGYIYTIGSCKSGCSSTRGSERGVTTYAPREASPTTEDTGEAQLRAGFARVALDPAFENVIDPSVYIVFVTPEGDNRGLYVTNRTPSGFDVRESNGGRSSIAFSYRVVAKPYGNVSPRLPFASLHRRVLTPFRERRTR
jgi:hypothetical protein